MNERSCFVFVLSSCVAVVGCSGGSARDGGASGAGNTPASGGSAMTGGVGGLGASGGSTTAGASGSSQAGAGGISPGGSGGSTNGGASGAGGGGGSGAAAGSGGMNDAATGSEGTPPVLSQAGLFEADMTTLSSGVRPFEPRYQLWADAATKRRWIWLPEGTEINTTDMEYWEFPVGTRVYKEFSLDGRRIETRRLEKRDNGSWSRVSYLWRADSSDADAVPVGAENASGTEHDVPSAQACGNCHLRMPDKILGFSAIQLAHDDPDATAWTLSRLAAEGKLSIAPPATLELPGDDTARSALGYLHANCGHCHHPLSVVTSRIQINLWLRTDSLADVLTTPTYQSTVSQTPLSETRTPTGSLIIDPGSPETSTLFLRIDSRGADYSMPPLGTELVDASGRAAVGDWIRSL